MSSAWTGFVSFIMVFIGSVAYLRTRALKWDWLSVASAEVGVAFFTIVLVTGPIWAKPVWGIWWTWDARLTSSFLLWVLFVSYLVLRTLVDEPERRAMVSAVFGIFAALDIPLVYFSIWWFRTQHPQPVIGDGGKLDARMGWVLLLSWAATARRDDGADPPALSPGSVAFRSRRDSHGDGAKRPLSGAGFSLRGLGPARSIVLGPKPAG